MGEHSKGCQHGAKLFVRMCDACYIAALEAQVRELTQELRMQCDETKRVMGQRDEAWQEIERCREAFNRSEAALLDAGTIGARAEAERDEALAQVAVLVEALGRSNVQLCEAVCGRSFETLTIDMNYKILANIPEAAKAWLAEREADRMALAEAYNCLASNARDWRSVNEYITRDGRHHGYILAETETDRALAIVAKTLGITLPTD